MRRHDNIRQPGFRANQLTAYLSRPPEARSPRPRARVGVGRGSRASKSVRGAVRPDPDGGQRLLSHLLAWPRHGRGGDLPIERAGGGNLVEQSARRLSASLAAVMVTPGSTAPVVSVTVPSIAPVVEPTVWPAAPCPRNSRYVTDETRTAPGLNTSFPPKTKRRTDILNCPHVRAAPRLAPLVARFCCTYDPSCGRARVAYSDETSSAAGSDNPSASRSVRFCPRRRFIGMICGRGRLDGVKKCITSSSGIS
jgi:hypothetical protein